MISIPRRENNRKVVNSIRTHEKTMAALGHVAGGWKRTADDPNIGPNLTDRASVAYTDTPARKKDSFFIPGRGGLGTQGANLRETLRAHIPTEDF